MADVKYSVDVDSSGAVKEVEKLEGAWKDLAKSGEDVKGGAEKAGGGIKNLVGRIGLGVAAADMAVKALRRLGQELRSVVTESSRQERAEEGLRAALELTGRTVEGNYQAYARLASEIQRTTRFGDEAVMEAEALLLQLTDLDQKGIEKAIKGAAGLASVFGNVGMSFDTAANLIAKALEGNIGALSRYGIKVDETLSLEEKRVELLKKLEGFYGRATADAQTYTGRIDQLKATISDMKEAVGDAVVRNEEFNRMLGQVRATLVAMIPEIREWVSGISEMISAMARVAMEAMEWIDKLKTKIGGMRGEVTEEEKAWNKLADSMGGFSEIVRQLSDRLTALGKTQTKEFGSLQELADKLWESYNEVGRTQTLMAVASGEFGDEVAGAFRDISGQGGELAIKLSGIGKEIIQVPPRVKAAGGAIVDTIKDVKAEVKSLDMSEAFKVEGKYGGLADIVGGLCGKVVAELGQVKAEVVELNEALGQSGKAWEAMTKSEIQARLGELRKQLTGMVRSGQYSQQAIDQIRQAIKGLESELRDTPRWVRSFAMAMEQINTYASQVFSGFNLIFQTAQRNREIGIDNEYKKRVDAINKSVMDEESRQKALMALEAEYEIKRTSAQRAAAKQAKAVAIMEAMVNTATAVTKALAQGGFLLGIPWAAVVGALGAAQVALISAQPIPLARGAIFRDRTKLMAESGAVYEMGEAGVEYLVPEKHLVNLLAKVPAVMSKEVVKERVEKSPMYVINVNSPLVRATGVAVGDLERVGADLYRIIEREGRRRGR